MCRRFSKVEISFYWRESYNVALGREVTGQMLFYSSDINKLEKVGKPSVFTYEPVEPKDNEDDFDFPF